MRAAAIGFTFVRIPLIFACLGIAYAIFRWQGEPDAFALTAALSTTAVTLTNVVNLILLRRLEHRDGRRLRDLIGYDRTRIGRDIAWGFCWLLVLMTPYLVAVTLVPLAIYRPDSAEAVGAVYQETFVGEYAQGSGELPVVAWVGFAFSLMFPFLNAPTEELHYRGWAQPRVGIALMAVAFGIQHVAFAPSPGAVVTYLVAYTLWAATAGIIYRHQQRLVPLIVAHFLTNAPFAVLPFVFAMTAG